MILTEKVLPPKTVVYYQGNEVEEMFFVVKGSIKVTNPNPNPYHASCVKRYQQWLLAFEGFLLQMAIMLFQKASLVDLCAEQQFHLALTPFQ